MYRLIALGDSREWFWEESCLRERLQPSLLLSLLAERWRVTIRLRGGDASDNPKEGVVRVFPDNNVPSFYKRCDGTTLIYWFEGDRRGGLTAVPDSPECK